MATRTMKEPKERLVTILVAPLMNCGAKLPVYALLIGAFFPGDRASIMFLLTIISWIMVLLAGRAIRSTVLSGPSAPFVLELPPYRVPTLQGLLIHTWERTWMYVKKAGTVILAVSILIWSLMTFPGLSEPQQAIFQEKQDKLLTDFLKDPTVTLVFKNQEDLKSFEGLDSAKGADPAEKLAQFLKSRNPDQGSQKDIGLPADLQQINAPVALKYTQYKLDKLRLENEEQSTKLKNTIAGRVGTYLVWVFKPIGFDWKTNVALLGGFAAKEVVVSTLGTAYSMGSVERYQYSNLSEQLRKEPGWNPLMAFTLIMFVMLYAPCVVTLVVIKRETGKWRWMLFAMVYTTVLAYFVAFIVKTTGTLLGIGLT